MKLKMGCVHMARGPAERWRSWRLLGCAARLAGGRRVVDAGSVVRWPRCGGFSVGEADDVKARKKGRTRLVGENKGSIWRFVFCPLHVNYCTPNSSSRDRPLVTTTGSANHRQWLKFLAQISYHMQLSSSRGPPRQGAAATMCPSWRIQQMWVTSRKIGDRILCLGPGVLQSATRRTA
ncbi:hypothetical protein BU16DRAFT_81512 [Lophium mytilinum]|uniref:Uncharacterized protein n=1 Tax=Lophium mytilinum TaxID=390894 RepID=A0A6A6QN05_9PEZI|nr:hypothetical protein BU16DRAFT_81512 [Lophium mytilinum]